MRPRGFGIWTTHHSLGRENAAEAARLVEQLGYSTFWLGGSPQLPEVRPLLEATSSLIVATGIVNVWSYEDPARLATEHAELEAEFPGRLLVGIGIGHPEATDIYNRPLATMAGFLDALDNAPQPLAPAARCLAALGPKMLDLSGARAAGACPYFTPVAHTAHARERLGPEALLAPELACILGDDPGRAAARDYARLYLRLGNYRNNLLRHGFDERDVADGGSDRLIDAVVPQGGAARIAELARAHVEAGADHVCLQTAGVAGIPREQWTALARELI